MKRYEYGFKMKIRGPYIIRHIPQPKRRSRGRCGVKLGTIYRTWTPPENWGPFDKTCQRCLKNFRMNLSTGLVPETGS